MEISSHNAFRAVFPRYEELIHRGSLTTSDEIEKFVREVLPPKVQIVRKMEITFTAFLSQYTNLILKRPQQANLIHSLMNRVGERLDQVFKSLDLQTHKLDKHSLADSLDFINFPEIRARFRTRLEGMNDLIKEKYLNAHGLDREVQEEIAIRLYNLLELYHFTKSDLATAASKYRLSQAQLMESVNSKNEPPELSSILSLDSSFIDYIHDIVGKRCRPFINKRDFFAGKLREIGREAESKVGQNFNILVDALLSKEKYRINKEVVSLLQRELQEIDPKSSEEVECKQIMLEVDDLKKQFNRVKNNAFFIDIMRGNFCEKYKMELNKLENLYYLSSLEKYLQDVTEFLEKVLQTEEKIITNRKLFTKNLGSAVQSKVQSVIDHFQTKALDRTQFEAVLDEQFQILESALYGVVEKPIKVAASSSNNDAEQKRKQRMREAEERRKANQAERQEKERLRKVELERKQQEDRRRREEQKVKMEERKRAEQARLEQLRIQKQQKQKERKQELQRVEREKREQLKKIEQKKKRQQEEENQRKQADMRRKQEQKQKAEENQRLKKQQLKAQREEQEKKIRQEAAKRKEEEEQRKAKEREALERKKEEERQRGLQEAQRRQQQEQERKRKLEEEKKRKQQELLKKQKEEEDRKKKQLQKERQAREKREKEEKERQQLAKKRQQQRKREQDQLKRKKQLQNEARIKKEQEEKLKKQNQERERRRIQEEAKRQKQERQKRQREEKLQREKEEKARQEAEAKRKRQEEEQRKKQEQLKKEQEEKLKRQLQNKKRLQAEQARKQKQAEELRIKKEKEDKQRKQNQERERKERQAKEEKERLQKLKIEELKKKQEEKKKTEAKGAKKSAIDYGDFDDLIDDDQEVDNIRGVQKEPPKAERKDDDQYLQDYDDDFEDFSPDKGDDDGQEDGQAIETKSLIDGKSLKCLNDYLKGTSFARKNKQNIEIYNDKKYYDFIFEQLVESHKLFIFETSVSKALLDFSLMLQDDSKTEEDLTIHLETINEEIMEAYNSRIDSPQFDKQTRLVFPFSFANQLGVNLVEIVPAYNIIQVSLKEELSADDENSFSALIQAFQHLFNIKEEPNISFVNIPPASKEVLQRFDKELPNLLLLFAMHYEQSLDSNIVIDQYTVERFFYCCHVLAPLYDAIKDNDEELAALFSGMEEKYENDPQIQVKAVQVQANSETYMEEIGAYSIKLKEQFLKGSIKTKTLLVMFQVLIPVATQEEEFYEKVTIYAEMSNGQGKPILNYFIVSKNDEEQENASSLFESVSNDYDDQFTTQVFIDFTRHNGLSEYSEWSLPLWAHVVQKRKMSAIDAFRAITLSMVPYYVAYKQQD